MALAMMLAAAGVLSDVISREGELEASKYWADYHRQQPVLVTGQMNAWAAFIDSGNSSRNWAKTLRTRLANVAVKSHCLHKDKDLLEKPLKALEERKGCHVFQVWI
jgi:hypothetical protein